VAETSDLTVEILRDIRDDIRGVRSDLGGVKEEVHQTNTRLDQTNARLDVVETTLKDMAGQFTLLAKFVRNS
jgi:flagellin-like hook-associated protein FlgL